ncbi:MFS transporter [Streptomonospora sp. S1-112]|uniref:MFS transporter n=1 Tax=Streptomonospora mangrovi TaxID=2883123 RepID=A0A9X3SFH2_9ACTN|nr:MFS transporter [Streptomonospora mangrovi]MDA0564750.1 MFS transporter [Streptomonospora mangrovi]
MPPNTAPPTARPAPEPVPARGWLAAVAVALGTFTVVTAEMMPVGLLTPMGAALGVSPGTAGLTLTITGLVAAVAAPPATPLAGRMDRRTVLVLTGVLLAVANLVAAAAPNFAVMVAARVLVGIGMGFLWTFAVGVAPRLVPGHAAAKATSIVFSGVAVASVLGVPLGTLLSGLAGWRAAFAAVAVLALVAAVVMAVLLPPLPAEGPVRVGGVVRTVRIPAVRAGLALTALLVGGHFAAYTYVRPVLEEALGAGAALIGTLLLVYGLAGVTGNFGAGAVVGSGPRRVLAAIAAVLAVVMPLVPWLGATGAGAAAALVVWGLAYGGVSVSTTAWTTAAAGSEREAASGLFVGVFNAAIGAGALLGGAVVNAVSPAAAMFTGGGLALAALLVAATARSPRPEA